ncbi:hypothetical protein B0H16DRAFT_1471257 [Mycena metata]|uniref:Uncharacterized protein n=1 Tax=Mycena metata TaxID=1033252 RepID=A0AAD7HRP8_9AGAR|nr:hypothetical protein B0H16DRAFT_1471257 [Mycena metata]
MSHTTINPASTSAYQRHTALTSTPAPGGSAPLPNIPAPASNHSEDDDSYTDERSQWIRGKDSEPTFILNEDQVLSFPPLTDLGSSISASRIASWDIDDIVFQVPTVMAEYRTLNNAYVQDRRAEAIRLCARAIQKSFLSRSKFAPRRLHEKVFKRELESLEDLLTHVEQSTTSLGDGKHAFRIKPDNYHALLNMLTFRLGQSISSFKEINKEPPVLPCWAAETALIEDWLEINVFEIIAVCFRLEIENFLTALDKRYNFTEATSRPYMTSVPEDEDVTAIKIGSKKNTGGSTEPVHQRDVPPHMNIPQGSSSTAYVSSKMKETVGDFDAIRRSQSTMYHNPNTSVRVSSAFNSGPIPTNNRRISEIFQPMHTLFEEDQNVDQSHGHAYQPEEYEQYRQGTYAGPL